MANLVYNRGKVTIGKNVWTSSSWGILLCTGTYVPAATDNTVSGVTNELVGGGYARVALAGLADTQNDANTRADYFANCPIFSGLSSTQTLRWAVIYQNSGSDATSDLVVALDMGAAGVNLTGITSYQVLFDSQASNGRVFSVT